MNSVALDKPIHHVILTYAKAVRRGREILIHGSANGNFRAYGELIPGTVVVLAEDEALGTRLSVPLDKNLRPFLLPGFSSRSVARRAMLYIRARRAIRQIVARSNFIQIHHPTSLGFIGAENVMSMGKPFYVDSGGSLLDPPGVSTPKPLRRRLAHIYYRRLEEKMADRMKLFIAVNAHLHRTFPPTNAPKIVVSHSVVAKDSLHKRDDACGRDDLRLFVATRMDKTKGIQHLIRAAKALIDESYDVSLRVAGTGDYLPALKELARDLGLASRVEFLGGIPPDQRLWAHYQKADIAVLPTLGHYEGTPRMILESWASGAPVVSTRVGGIPSLVNDGEDGLLVPPGDDAALVEAIKRTYHDADLRRRLVANGYRRAEHLTYESRLPILRRAFQEHLPGLLPE